MSLPIHTGCKNIISKRTSVMFCTSVYKAQERSSFRLQFLKHTKIIELDLVFQAITKVPNVANVLPHPGLKNLGFERGDRR
ncbi:hypothetical protein WG66_010301 [Moniliophthora roreri]|nr:hypothetical protein WG66_010301 [Moniliophthora roreri]